MKYGENIRIDDCGSVNKALVISKSFIHSRRHNMGLRIGMEVNLEGSSEVCHIFYLGKLQTDPVKHLSGFTVIDLTAVITNQIHAFIVEIQHFFSVFEIIDIPAGAKNKLMSCIRPFHQDFSGIIGNLLFMV